MNNAICNWQNTPLLRIETKVMTTPTNSDNEINCNGVALRYNMANIHEIKQFRNIKTGD